MSKPVNSDSSKTREDVEVHVRKTVYQGYFRIDEYRLRHRSHDGGVSDELRREVFERGHIAAVLPVDPERDTVVLIEQFRPGAFAAGWQPWVVECVAGIVEPGESTADVVVREAVEETGCQVTDLVCVSRFLSSPGASSETVELFCGRTNSDNAGGVYGLREEGEDIKAFVVSIEHALGMLKRGEIVNAKTIVALQWLALNYGELKKHWL